MLNVEQIVICGFVLGVTLLPVIAWQRSRSMVLPLAGFYVIFVFVTQGAWDAGHLPVTHDAGDNFFGLFSLVRQWLVENHALAWNPYLGGGAPDCYR